MSIQIYAGLALTTLCLGAGEAQNVEVTETSPTQKSVRLAQFEKPRLTGKNGEYTPPNFLFPRGIDWFATFGLTWPPPPLKSNASMSLPEARGEIAEGLQLSARPRQYQVEVLQPIIFELVLRNTTGKVIEIYPTSVDEKDYVAEVKDVMGRVVPLTVYGKLLDPSSPHKMPYSGNLILGRQKFEVKPQQEFVSQLTINQMNDMSLSGSYFITIRTPMAKGLTSNTVQIDVFQRYPLPILSAPAEGKESLLNLPQ